MLKYRVFDVRENKFITDFSTIDFSIHPDGIMTLNGDSVSHDNYVVQEQIGLVDSTGTLLYEGDIITFNERILCGRYYQVSKHAIITYLDGAFVFRVMVTPVLESTMPEELYLSIKPYVSVSTKVGTVFSNEIDLFEMIEMEKDKRQLSGVEEIKLPESKST